MKNTSDDEQAQQGMLELQTLNLQGIKRSVRRHWRGASVIVLLSISLASIYTAVRAPVNKVRSSVLIENKSQSVVANAETGVMLTREVTEAQRILASTTPVLQRALELCVAKRPDDPVLKQANAITIEKMFYPNVSSDAELHSFVWHSLCH